MAEPEIISFVADPATILRGQPTILRWRTSEADGVSIVTRDGSEVPLGTDADPAAGEVEVTPTSSTTYVLRARNAGDTVEKEFAVEVLDEQEIVAELWLVPDRVPFGSDAILHWNSEKADKIQIYQGDKLVVNTIQPSGTHTVSVEDSVEFKMEAEGQLGKETATAKLIVVPSIESFTSSVDREQYPGDPVQVEWRTRGADELRVQNADGLDYEVRAEERNRGSANLPVGMDGVFVLVATRAGEETRQELSIPVVGAPRFDRILFDPPAITTGTGQTPDVRITWQTANAKTLEIESSSHGLLDLQGKRFQADSIIVPAVAEGTVFTFRASNGGQEIEEERTFAGVPLAQVVSFRAAPARVGSGEPFQLIWETVGAERVEVYRLGPGGTRQRISAANEPPVGSLEQSITQPTNFELLAFNLAGDPVEFQTGVSVGGPVLGSVTIDPPTAAPGDKVRVAWSSDGGSHLSLTGPSGVVYETTDALEIEAGEFMLAVGMEEGVFPLQFVITNGAGNVTRNLELLVTSGPRVLDFTASPAQIRKGEQVEFAWSVTPDGQDRTVSLELRDDLGNVYDVSGADVREGRVVREVPDAGVRTFTLEAKAGAAQPTSRTAEVEVFGEPGLVLTLDPPAYDPFDPGTLPRIRWQTTFATRVLIHELDDMGEVARTVLDEVRRAQVRQGNFGVLPPEQGGVYRVVAENPWGESTMDEIFIDYYLPTVESFTVTPTTVPKNGTVTLNWVTHGGHTFLHGPLLLNNLVELFGENFESIAGLPGTNQVSMLNCNSGTGVNEDEGCVIVDFPSGFTFPYDGVDHSQVRFGTNGWVGFNLAVTGPGSVWSTFPGFSYPTNEATWAQILPWGGDLWFIQAGQGYRWRMDADEQGQKAIFEWHTSSPSLTQLQLVLRESGAFEYRYSNSMPSATYGWAYQNLKATRGMNIPNKPASNLLANRAFRYEPRVQASDSMNFQLEETTTFRLCVYGADWVPVCESQTVTVTP